MRIVPCPLPIKSPWLNPIEPKWVHSKRKVVEPDRLLSAANWPSGSAPPSAAPTSRISPRRRPTPFTNEPPENALGCVGGSGDWGRRRERWRPVGHLGAPQPHRTGALGAAVPVTSAGRRFGPIRCHAARSAGAHRCRTRRRGAEAPRSRAPVSWSAPARRLASGRAAAGWPDASRRGFGVPSATAGRRAGTAAGARAAGAAGGAGGGRRGRRRAGGAAHGADPPAGPGRLRHRRRAGHRRRDRAGARRRRGRGRPARRRRREGVGGRRALGDRALALEADVTDSGQLERAVAATVARFGGIDAVLVNAGIEILGGVGELEPEAFQRVIDVDLVGSWRTVRATLPAVAARQGYYLLAASLAAVAHAPLNGAYSAAKAGLVALAKTMRLELAPRGVAVGIAYLPYVETAAARRAVDDPRLQALFASAPRLGPRRSPSTASPTATSAPSPPGSAGCSSTAPRWSPCTCRSSRPPWASGSCAGRWSDSPRCDEHGGARANRAVAWPRRPGGRPGRRLTAKETEKPRVTSATVGVWPSAEETLCAFCCVR